MTKTIGDYINGKEIVHIEISSDIFEEVEEVKFSFIRRVLRTIFPFLVYYANFAKTGYTLTTTIYMDASYSVLERTVSEPIKCYSTDKFGFLIGVK